MERILDSLDFVFESLDFFFQFVNLLLLLQLHLSSHGTTGFSHPNEYLSWRYYESYYF